MISLLLSAAIWQQPAQTSYAGLPELSSVNKYRILTENVAINLVSGDRVRVASTTVYRNIGEATTAIIRVVDGSLTSKSKISKVLGTWDDVPITFEVHTEPGQDPFATASVAMGKESTHSLKLNVFGKLARTGYAKDQYDFRYKLIGDHPIDLFSLAYRYASGSVFGLPTVKPDLGWEVGPKGAAIRKTDFTPSGIETSIEFYRNGLDNLGSGE